MDLYKRRSVLYKGRM